VYQYCGSSVKWQYSSTNLQMLKIHFEYGLSNWKMIKHTVACHHTIAEIGARKSIDAIGDHLSSWYPNYMNKQVSFHLKLVQAEHQ